MFTNEAIRKGAIIPKANESVGYNLPVNGLFSNQNFHKMLNAYRPIPVSKRLRDTKRPRTTCSSSMVKLLYYI